MKWNSSSFIEKTKPIFFVKPTNIPDEEKIESDVIILSVCVSIWMFLFRIIFFFSLLLFFPLQLFLTFFYFFFPSVSFFRSVTFYLSLSQYTHDVVSTSVRRNERCMDVEMTSCAYGYSINPSSFQLVQAFRHDRSN